MAKNRSRNKTKLKKMTKLSKWQSKLDLKEWSFTTEEILPTQVLYDNDCPVKDRYFVGIEINQENKVGTIYQVPKQKRKLDKQNREYNIKQ
jgi:hypothetical protein